MPLARFQYEVHNWKKALQENGLFSIKNVGNFSLNADKNLIFTPYDQTNYLTNSFGLSAFVSPVVKREIFEHKIEALEENFEESEVIEFIPERRRTSAYLKYAAIFVLGLGLTGAVGYPVYQQQIANETIIVEKSVQKQVQNKIQGATFFIENPVPAVTLTVKEDQKCPITLWRALLEMKEMPKKKFEQLIQLKDIKRSRIPQNKHGLFPVLYGSYTTFSEAEKLNRKFKIPLILMLGFWLNHYNLKPYS